MFYVYGHKKFVLDEKTNTIAKFSILDEKNETHIILDEIRTKITKKPLKIVKFVSHFFDFAFTVGLKTRMPRIIPGCTISAHIKRTLTFE